MGDPRCSGPGCVTLSYSLSEVETSVLNRMQSDNRPNITISNTNVSENGLLFSDGSALRCFQIENGPDGYICGEASHSVGSYFSTLIFDSIIQGSCDGKAFGYFDGRSVMAIFKPCISDFVSNVRRFDFGPTLAAWQNELEKRFPSSVNITTDPLTDAAVAVIGHHENQHTEEFYKKNIPYVAKQVARSASIESAAVHWDRAAKFHSVVREMEADTRTIQDLVDKNEDDKLWAYSALRLDDTPFQNLFSNHVNAIVSCTLLEAIDPNSGVIDFDEFELSLYMTTLPLTQYSNKLAIRLGNEMKTYTTTANHERCCDEEYLSHNGDLKMQNEWVVKKAFELYLNDYPDGGKIKKLVDQHATAYSIFLGNHPNACLNSIYI